MPGLAGPELVPDPKDEELKKHEPRGPVFLKVGNPSLPPVTAWEKVVPRARIFVMDGDAIRLPCLCNVVIELIVGISLRPSAHNTWRHGIKDKRTRNWDKIGLGMGTWMVDAGS